MQLYSNSLALVSLVALALVYPCLAQNSPQDYINAHNAIRAQVGVGPMKWDNEIAANAQNYANQRISDCSLTLSHGEYGENLARATGFFTGVAAVNLWASQKPNYDYASNSCVKGECRSYTQVVWRKSVRLGCARVRCKNGYFFVVCNYEPKGNYLDQRPY